MPSGRTHETATLVLVLPGALALGTQDLLLGAAYLTGGLVGAFFLNPDIDLEDSRPSRRWGPLSLLWAPYRLLFPHRSASHSWVLGPLSRLAYLVLLGLVLWSGLKAANLLPNPALFGEVKDGWPVSGKVLWGLLAGWLSAEWLHLAMDGIPLRRLLR